MVGDPTHMRTILEAIERKISSRMHDARESRDETRSTTHRAIRRSPDRGESNNRE